VSLRESINGVVESFLGDVPQVHEKRKASLRIERRRTDARQLPTPARFHKFNRAIVTSASTAATVVAVVGVLLLFRIVDDAEQ
jgi:hypothetical protein